MIAAALLLAAGVAAEQPGWVTNGSSGEVFWINNSETRPGEFGRIDVWIHSRRPALAKGSPVPKGDYRASLQRLSFDCKGNAILLAITTFNDLGEVIYSWDGWDSTAIRPGTVFAAAEAFTCGR